MIAEIFFCVAAFALMLILVEQLIQWIHTRNFRRRKH
jgi:hypothetical protein